ncbi:MAG: energy-coupling factor transporter ATPase [Anaerolineales bacterium]
MNTQPPLITLDNVTYTYPRAGADGPSALHKLSLQIAAGEYVALIGANGSGKSTLARHLNALLAPDAGHVRIAGDDTRDPARWPEIRRAVGMVFQRPDDQIVATVVEQDVAFGLENLGLPAAEIRARVRAALESVALWAERERPPHLLSVGQMQRLALAGVLAMRPRCIVFDEATAMLDPAGRRAVREQMRRLHREGLTIVAITHFMEEALDAERVIVLDQGRMAMSGPPKQIFAQEEQLRALGLALPPAADLAQRLRAAFPALPRGVLTVEDLITAVDALPHRNEAEEALEMPATPAPSDPLIEVRDLGHIYLRGTPLARRALRDISLTVGEGEAHGLLGATGAGKSTLMQHLNGLLRPQEGKVRVGAFDINADDVDLKAVRRWVGLAFQMPEVQIFEQYVGDEIAYGPRLAGLDRPALRERVRWAMSLVGLDFEAFKDRLTFTLSGGERRKVALASILALQPHVLLLDEPTAGLDPGSRREVLAHLRALMAEGMTVALSSHQMEDLAALTQRLTVLDQGTTELAGSVSEVFAQGSRLRALGLDAPVVTQLVEGLRARGWPLPAGMVRVAALKRALEQMVVAQ